MSSVEPILKLVPILDLRPTQITMGAREVKRKRDNWREKTAREEGTFLGDHLVPVVVGPGDVFYLVDHHHLALALHQEGQEKVLVEVQARLSHLGKDEFLRFMDKRAWLHPFDEKGRRQSPEALPKTVEGLVDDPFRSVAGELREAGGYSKDTTPFSEFLWADYLRDRMDATLARDNPKKALAAAWDIARHKDASFLPGWCGP